MPNLQGLYHDGWASPYLRIFLQPQAESYRDLNLRGTVPDPQQPIEQGFSPRLTQLGRDSPQLQLADTAAATDKEWKGLPRRSRWQLRAVPISSGYMTCWK